MRIAARGQICIWPGGSLWIGSTLLRAEVHAHHAMQMAFALEGQVRFRRRSDADWSLYGACIIPPSLPHAFDGAGSLVAHVFVDPETPEGHSLRARLRAGAIAPLDADDARDCVALLNAAWVESHECPRLVPVARDVVRRLAGTEPPRVTTDPRVLGAIELIRARLGDRVRLTDIARDLNISASRLRHLFAEEVGLPFRTYVLWQRLQRIFQRAETETLTEAALAAGFADAAHMTRTFRRMLGLAPSAFERA
jgi:AraC-like DNA-binding protein